MLKSDETGKIKRHLEDFSLRLSEIIETVFHNGLSDKTKISLVKQTLEDEHWDIDLPWN